MPPWARPTLFRQGRPGKLKIFLKHPLDWEKTQFRIQDSFELRKPENFLFLDLMSVGNV
jgi:hypothetical protein